MAKSEKKVLKEVMFDEEELIKEEPEPEPQLLKEESKKMTKDQYFIERNVYSEITKEEDESY